MVFSWSSELQVYYICITGVLHMYYRCITGMRPVRNNGFDTVIQALLEYFAIMFLHFWNFFWFIWRCILWTKLLYCYCINCFWHHRISLKSKSLRVVLRVTFYRVWQTCSCSVFRCSNTNAKLKIMKNKKYVVRAAVYKGLEPKLFSNQFVLNRTILFFVPLFRPAK